MEQKRVTFEVAKALKKAGYPQQDNTAHYVDYEGSFYFHYWAEPECAKWINFFAAPTYLDVWPWLWQEKHIFIKAHVIHKEFNYQILEYQDGWKSYGIVDSVSYRNPEDAIEAAIKYLVENDLIK